MGRKLNRPRPFPVPNDPAQREEDTFNIIEVGIWGGSTLRKNSVIA